MAGTIQTFDDRRSMGSRQFEVFHYRERRPGNMEVHHHDFFEICFLLGGEVRFRVEGKTFALEPGDMLLINPRELHHAIISRDTLYERIVLWIDKNFITELSGGGEDLSACFDTGLPTHSNRLHPTATQRVYLQGLLERLVGEFYGSEPGSALYARGLLTQFLVEVNRISAKTKEDGVQEKNLIDRVLSYIGEHYRENLTLEEIASAFYVSKYHLSHAFSHQVGTSIYRYIQFRRLMHARELLEAGEMPGEVYPLCGFGDYTNFYRAFKGAFGCSPREFIRDRALAEKVLL